MSSNPRTSICISIEQHSETPPKHFHDVLPFFGKETYLLPSEVKLSKQAITQILLKGNKLWFWRFFFSLELTVQKKKKSPWKEREKNKIRLKLVLCFQHLLEYWQKYVSTIKKPWKLKKKKKLAIFTLPYTLKFAQRNRGSALPINGRHSSGIC